MAKQKTNPNQLAFENFVPVSRDAQDAILEREIAEKHGRYIARDDDPRLLKWRRDYFEWWVENYPDGNLARMRRLNSERKE